MAAGPDPGQRRSGVRHVPARAGWFFRFFSSPRTGRAVADRRSHLAHRCLQRPHTRRKVRPARGVHRTGEVRARTVSDTDELSVLAEATRYLFQSLLLVRAADLSAPTPCQDWDLRRLLGHVRSSLADVADVLAVRG